LRLLIDNNLAPRIARCLDALFDEHQIRALREEFAPDTVDVEWITDLSRRGGFAVLTRDLHIRTRPHERAALDNAKIVFFFLAGAWRGFSVEETTARLIRLIPKMAAQTELAERGRFELPVNAGSKLRPHRS
jgi:PIN like domain